MKPIVITLLLAAVPADRVAAQTCYGGYCYPQLPAARLVMPLDSQPATSSAAHCRIYVADGSVGSGTLIAKNQATGLVLTCSHLFDGGTSSVVAVFADGRRYGARLVDRDPANDLAAVLIKRPDSEPVEVNDAEPAGVITACGYGGNGQFRPVRGQIAGAAQAIGATYPSVKITAAVRPGDSGGAALDSAGRLVGVVWGCRDGETYLTCGRPLRQFLDRVWPDRPGKIASRADESPSSRGDPIRDDDWERWREEFESRVAALDAKKQDRGEYLQADELAAYAKKSDVASAVAESKHDAANIEQRSASRIEALRTSIHERVDESVRRRIPGALSGLSMGKLLAGALGLSGPIAIAVMIAGGLAGRRIKRRIVDSSGSQPSKRDARLPIAVDSPPPPQQTVPESHYVPVERDEFAKAHQWAREQVARKYPGATEVLTTLESLIKQQLAGNGSNPGN